MLNSLSAKHIVVISSNTLLSDLIKDNLPKISFTLVLTSSKAKKYKEKDKPQEDNSLLKPYGKIDLLLINTDNFYLDLKEFYRIKTIINLTSNSIFSDGEIKVSKPFKVNHLLELIRTLSNKDDIFCDIYPHFIYDEQSSSLYSEARYIKLTEKENKIFKFILLAANYKIDKDSLLTNVWKYHKNTTSSTVETHLYKLKMKLPNELLQIKNNVCYLNITADEN